MQHVYLDFVTVCSIVNTEKDIPGYKETTLRKTFEIWNGFIERYLRIDRDNHINDKII